jgi:hypothetical protein
MLINLCLYTTFLYLLLLCVGNIGKSSHLASEESGDENIGNNGRVKIR